LHKRWLQKPFPDKELFDSLKKEIQTSDILLSLIAQRNLQNIQEAHSYFVPSLEHLHSPFLMKDMDKAVERIHRAIENKEKIVVYGDYDVDGTTSVALLYSFLKAFYDHVLYYIPDRFKEGYGISLTGIDWAKENGAKLIIALDCGIKSIEPVAYAAKSDIDFIIGDHHKTDDVIPSAAAVLNPKRADCPYPFKELSGCGIAFKLAQAYAEAYRLNWELEKDLQLVAISIASDIVNMTGENRILTYFGLQQINSNPIPAVKALIH
jgi:single-stranded-DNA-specific exonuclease